MIFILYLNSSKALSCYLSISTSTILFFSSACLRCLSVDTRLLSTFSTDFSTFSAISYSLAFPWFSIFHFYSLYFSIFAVLLWNSDFLLAPQALLAIYFDLVMQIMIFNLFYFHLYALPKATLYYFYLIKSDDFYYYWAYTSLLDISR